MQASSASAAAVRHAHAYTLAQTAAPAIAEVFAYAFDQDRTRVALPHPEIHVVARFGPAVPGGLDVHAMGAREKVYRKHIRSGMRAIMARLRLGATESVLGVPASALVDRVVALDDLWGREDASRLLDRLAGAPDLAGGVVTLRAAIAERRARNRGPHTRLALDAARRLTHSNVSAVAGELGVSERHLRRVFRETVGVSPKAYAKLTRFHRALDAARESEGAGWASIAAAAGYYDQAHLIAEFRAIAGVTPRALLGELRTAPLVG